MTLKNRYAENAPTASVEAAPLLLNEKETAKRLGVSLSFLRKARCEGAHHNRTESPPFVRLGGRVYYPREDLLDWLAGLARRTVI
jgi:hypothetical protein